MGSPNDSSTSWAMPNATSTFRRVSKLLYQSSAWY